MNILPIRIGKIFLARTLLYYSYNDLYMLFACPATSYSCFQTANFCKKNAPIWKKNMALS